MASFERSVLVRAPLAAVWTFHTAVDGLVAASPDWLGLAVESVAGPDGEPDPERILEGTEVTVSTRPLGVGPRWTMTTRITRLDRGADRAELRDEQVDGPFGRWAHTHRFATAPGGTRLTDHVEYELPIGPLRELSTLAWPGFAAVFAARHRRTKRHLE